MSNCETTADTICEVPLPIGSNVDIPAVSQALASGSIYDKIKAIVDAKGLKSVIPITLALGESIIITGVATLQAVAVGQLERVVVAAVVGVVGWPAFLTAVGVGFFLGSCTNTASDIVSDGSTIQQIKNGWQMITTLGLNGLEEDTPQMTDTNYLGLGSTQTAIAYNLSVSFTRNQVDNGTVLMGVNYGPRVIAVYHLTVSAPNTDSAFNMTPPELAQFLGTLPFDFDVAFNSSTVPNASRACSNTPYTLAILSVLFLCLFTLHSRGPFERKQTV